jgi:hypothetical protein
MFDAARVKLYNALHDLDERLTGTSSDRPPSVPFTETQGYKDRQYLLAMGGVAVPATDMGLSPETTANFYGE